MKLSVLMVPIHLDAFYLTSDRTVIEPMADFTRLPYFDGERDVNPDVANISEEMLSQPFQDRGLQLKPGVHLHWALPDALTRGVSQGGSISFPVVPNRWLVTRTDETGTDKKQWVVESDYLYPPGEGDERNGISYPYADGKHPQPFRYLGRAMPLPAWQNRNTSSQHPQYLGNLTAVGYGEPAFAAFYPNCHSVFGFYDEGPPQNLAGVRYDVIGWYRDRDPSQDCLQIKAFKDLSADQAKYQALQEYYRWVIPDIERAVNRSDATSPPLPSFPEQTICYACVTFQVDPAAQPASNLAEEQEIAIAVGNTSTEALSVYLAHTLDGDASILEDQLEAIHLADRLEGRKLDLGFKFQEARHEKEFTAVPAGILWTIRPESAAPAQANASEVATQARMRLPYELADELHQLNMQQQAYDRDCDEVEAMQKQLFADWYKYMLCAYPPEGSRDGYPNLDEVRYFLEKTSLFPLQRRIARNNALRVQLAQTFTDLRDRVAELSRKGTPYALRSIPAPRYWQPNEPVVLLPAEPTERHGHDGRLREDGALECQITSLDAPIEQSFDAIRHTIQDLDRKRLRASIAATSAAEQDLKGGSLPKGLQDVLGHAATSYVPMTRVDANCWSFTLDKQEYTIRKEQGKLNLYKACIGFTTWTEQPWHPFLLEWEVEVFPLRGKYRDRDPHTVQPLTRNYDADCITANYQLAEDAVDLTIQPGQETVAKEATVYTGRSILTPHAKLQLIAQIESFLEKQLLNDYYNAQGVKPADQTNEYFTRNLDAIIAWYGNLAAGKQDDVTNQILAVYQHLHSNFHVLAQSLSGFNEALLMHKQTLQLPIRDPLGFADYQPFTEAVRVAVDKSLRVAPQPHDDFNPIRTGVLHIRRLRLVDTFGQVQTISPKDDQVITTDTMDIPANPHLVILPPRLVQPARIHFRWLAADGAFTPEEDDDPEMNAHSATTPICGWLLPNHLDGSLMVYDGQGKALGSISPPLPGRQNGASSKNAALEWTPAPGPRPVGVHEIANINQHLYQLVDYLIQQGDDFLEDFMTAIERALDNIEPEHAAHHDALALLMGRPVAVVRATVSLELQGLPAVDEAWNTFRQEVEFEAEQAESAGTKPIARETQNFTQVQFPIRIGEHKQLNDGLIGYWVEEESGNFQPIFYAPQTEQDSPEGRISHRDIVVHRKDRPMNILQAIDSPPTKLTMLVDPRGAVHATSGILPTKAIHIPVEQFAEALRSIEVTFLAAPILSDRGTINLPLPAEPGYAWSWVAKANGLWTQRKEIGAVNAQATFAAPQEIREGWLKLTETDGG